MIINKFFAFFAPRDRKFFTLFNKASSNMVDTAKVLTELLNAPLEKRREYIKKIEDLEHVGDEITHEIFTELSANFITPFDREDILHLASAMDDVVDYIFASSKRIDLYKIGEITDPMRRLAEIIEQSTQELHIALTDLKSLNNYTRIREALVKVNSLENNADDIFNMAIANLFEHEKDAITVIKYQEIYANLETATDKCEDVANAIESILIKNS